MDTTLAESALKVLEFTSGHAFGSAKFYFTVGVSMAAWVIAARLFMVMFSTSRGFVAAFLACAFSLAAGLLGYVVVEQYVLPKMEVDWAAGVLPLTGLVIFVLVSIFVLTKRILKMSAGGTIFIYIVATMVAACALFGVHIATGLMDAGSGQVEQRDKRMQEELDSIY